MSNQKRTVRVAAGLSLLLVTTLSAPASAAICHPSNADALKASSGSRISHTGFGAGTNKSPHEIWFRSQFRSFAKASAAELSRAYVQCATIDLSTMYRNDLPGSNHFRIGSNARPFTGSYNGRGHLIRGFKDRLDASDNRSVAGLFGVIRNATVRNVRLAKASIGIDLSQRDRYTRTSIGLLAGKVLETSKIRGVSVKGNINVAEGRDQAANGAGDLHKIGGLIGSSVGWLKNDLRDDYRRHLESGYEHGELTPFEQGAGTRVQKIANVNTNVEIISGAKALYVGGLVGRASDLKISDIKTAGFIRGSDRESHPPVNGELTAAGGLLGEAFNVSINFVQSAVNIQSNSFAGGLVGGLEWSLISRSFSTGHVSTEATYAGAGGLVGGLSSSAIKWSYATGSVQSRRLMFGGGLVGVMVDVVEPSDISNSYARGNVFVTNEGVGGGFVGVVAMSGKLAEQLPAPVMTHTYASGSVYGAFAAGFVGTVDDREYLDAGEVTVVDQSFAAGRSFSFQPYGFGPNKGVAMSTWYNYDAMTSDAGAGQGVSLEHLFDPNNYLGLEMTVGPRHWQFNDGALPTIPAVGKRK